MENRPRVPKLFILLLGVVLIAGALAAVMSINGQWLTANPVSAQPPDTALEQNVIPATGSNSDSKPLEQQYAPSGPGCNHDSEMNPSDF